ncbi:MAG: alanine--glyoxylate aminotransferase family protein [Bacteroidetes bacterium]|nr:MAG: alanine--glyoxylate aminotransferase family protein [Bacteroidota bacterium]
MTHLLTPGPVPIPPSVQAALARPVIHHRTPVFRAFYQEMLTGLRYLFQTEQGVGTMVGSGTLGVEAAMYSLFRPADPVLVVSMGKFSGRWAAYARLLGLHVHTLEIAWGECPSPEAIAEKATALPALKGVVLTHSETSTGVVIDLETIAHTLRELNSELLILVDGITSVGAIPYYHDAWGIDAALVASQKSLQNPAGLVAFALSERAISALRATDPSDYRNLYHYLRQARTGDYPYTPPVQLLFGVDAVLKQIRAESLPLVWNRTHQSAARFRAGLSELGGVVFPPAPGDALTAFAWPGQDIPAFKQRLEAEGYLLAGGQGELKGKILRVAHFGYATPDRMRGLLAAMLRAKA